ncbi:hypothetical protein ACFYNF_34105 [Streptomyces sp. NPDC006641]|uniref:hypothetical protein n=1 Tax=unclassified Streptomyces TaxID=2593676 RepID=UPI00368C399A
MSATLDPREVEAITSPDNNTQPPAEPPPDVTTDLLARPHEPGARPAPLSRLLYP